MRQIYEGTPEWFKNALEIEPENHRKALDYIYKNLWSRSPESLGEEFKFIFNNYEPASLSTIILLALLIVSRPCGPHVEPERAEYGEKIRVVLSQRAENPDRLLGDLLTNLRK